MLVKHILIYFIASMQFHLCNGNQILCCQTIWCDTCYIEHLKLDHSAEAFYAFAKIMNLYNLISAPRTYVSPQEKLDKQIAKDVKLSNKPKSDTFVRELVNQMNQESLERFREFIVERNKEQLV